MVKLSILACAPGAVNGAITTTSLDLRETDDVHVAVADICSEIGAARGRTPGTRQARSSTPLRAPRHKVNAGDDRAWEPPAKQTSNESTKAAIGRASGCAALTVRANSALKSSSASVTCWRSACGLRCRRLVPAVGVSSACAELA